MNFEILSIIQQDKDLTQTFINTTMCSLAAGCCFAGSAHFFAAAVVAQKRTLMPILLKVVVFLFFYFALKDQRVYSAHEIQPYVVVFWSMLCFLVGGGAFFQIFSRRRARMFTQTDACENQAHGIDGNSVKT